MTNKHVKNIIGARDLKKSITRGQYKKYVDTVRGQRGYKIKSKVRGEYEIHIRWYDTSFNWLGWDNPHQDVWDVMFNYPDNFLKWVYNRTGINLDNVSDEELAEFLFKTGMIVIKGKPTKYGYAKANLIVSNLYETLVNSINRVKK